MNTQRLTAVLGRAVETWPRVENLRTEYQKLIKKISLVTPRFRYTIARLAPSGLQEVIAALRQEQELQIFSKGWQVLWPCFRSLSFENLASWLIWRARELSPERALADLEQYLGQKKIPVHSVGILLGVQVADEFSSGRGVKILPFWRVPESFEKSWILPLWAVYPTSLLRPQL